MMATTTTVTAEQNDAAVTTRISAPSYRLLYRGALALQDSEILLDGIVFVMSVAFKSPFNLISSPIPLGLESMRGRPLRLVSTIDISEVSIECTGDVSMYVHPEAFLARSFIERTLCDSNHPLVPDRNQMRTSVAIRIGLGDGQGPDESDILVFGQLETPTFPYKDTSQPTPTLKLLAGRIAPPVAPSTPPRAPRPDDPLPRSHPLANLHLSPGRRGMKRKRSSLSNPFADAKTPPNGSSAPEGSAGSALMAALAEAQAQSERQKKNGKIVMDAMEIERKGITRRPTLFRVPSKRGSDKGQLVDRDGFLVPRLPVHALVARTKGKEKESDARKSTPEKAIQPTSDPNESELETKNKTAIKKRTLSALEACGITKSHADFKDTYSWIHRGVGFAVRNVIRDTKVDRNLITKLVEMHLEMYFGGRGGKFAMLTEGGEGASTSRSAGQVLDVPQLSMSPNKAFSDLPDHSISLVPPPALEEVAVAGDVSLPDSL